MARYEFSPPVFSGSVGSAFSRSTGRVPRFDRYLLSQLLSHFGFFALVLVGVYWINRAVTLFDQLMSDGQSLLVFVQISVLTLPNVIKLVLPVAAFVASVYVSNKLIAESELVVMQATGFSAFRMARPVLFFGIVVALMMAALVHFLVPMSRTTMIAQRAALSENITARFLTDGQFTHPSKQVTFYINQIDPNGQLRDIFLEDGRRTDEVTTFTARKALFVRGDSGPKLIMFDGMAQTLDRATQRLSTTRFADFTYDLGALLTRSVGPRRAMQEMSTPELLWPTEGVLTESRASPAALLYEAHHRLAEPVLSVAVALIGFAALLLGGFSRLGLWRQIGIAIGLLVILQGTTTVSAQMGPLVVQGWALAYIAPLLGLAMAGTMLWWAGRPRSIGKAALS
jgi:lipopolysaccharide export system permease protein